MLFWLAAALLTVAASLSVLVPLARAKVAGNNSIDADLRVYRDQLDEVERDAARGLIAGSEIEQARAEIGRRILKLELGEAGAARPSRSSRIIVTAAIAMIPLVSWSLYAALGSPDLPSQPLQERLARNPSDSSVDELVARAERHLAENPGDGRGWDVLAPIYLRLGQFAQSVTAYQNAIRLLGADANRESGLGEAIAAAAGGIVTADAEAALRRATALDAKNIKARFFLALGSAQQGSVDEARRSWQDLQAELPPDSSWRPAIASALSELDTRVASSIGGPSAEQVDAAAQMTATERQSMIEGMVASLDARLKENPSDPAGWTRLVRSYAVLGRRDEAQAALERGVRALAGDAAGLEMLRASAASLGFQPSGVKQ